MEASVNRRNPKLRSACNRCYELKERCERATTSVYCARCRRLGLACSTARPVRVSRSAHDEKAVSRLSSGKCRRQQQHQPTIDSCLEVLSDQRPEERELLQFLLGQAGSLDHYVVCPSFQIEQRQSLATQLRVASPLVKDAYLACASTLKQLQSGIVTNKDVNISIAYISKAMCVLRSLPTLRSEDTVLWHILGSMLAFSIYSAIGVGVSEICRFCLGTTSSFLDTKVLGAPNDPWQNLLVLLETTDCLVYRRKPTVRIQVPALGTVDRHLGLSLPLLPHYHDLCAISSTLLHTTEVNTLACLQKQIDDIQSIVEPWQPYNLDQLVDQFDSAEIVHLLAQAKAYRLGVLLIGHRLRYTFGQEDAQADIWSNEIMMELDMAYRVTKRPIRFVTLPFMIAALEVRDQDIRAKTLQRVDDCVEQYSPLLQKTAKTFLTRIWCERDLNLTSPQLARVVNGAPGTTRFLMRKRSRLYALLLL
ncbi:conserved hypothetical protein [Talaromyces stipitatus ATCC 10500]|uniref:Zn(2)-C6 fungal-type domain-containing protein n=1 Tax=Talaromyces stipitatus (strain ATCC 10500 / CBS 375.48 / QM 6759 / NRRL 1006) TaxID=441959 RepID=B8MM44_TALSN|nr:uncharacterized protein TSTA_098130 [Talaromyces stipitatus ATCC 10500]EED13556.1 conserved hypothetical protein [Talaromyces stipitatus ATCC 10500]